MDLALFITLFGSALRATTPLLFAALGGLFSERSGVVNIALEGIILFGALAAAVTSERIEFFILASNPDANLAWVPWVGVLAGIVVGGLT
ncbi:MAG TPA: ABC transporter permease, partial [Trueperaceae bacterium]|nr:ABC transporter permease [Trueperaceae bacterium]